MGGASKGFFTHNNWNVIRVDNNPLLQYVPNTWNIDVMDLGPGSFPLCEFDLIWASPPCLEFSQAFGAPGPVAKRAGLEFEPDLDLVKKCLDLIAMWKPDWWVIENVIGSIPHFEKIGLVPTQIIGPFVLYGKFPRIVMPNEWKWEGGKTQDWNIDHPLRANLRAVVPREISRGLRVAIDTQRTLEDYA